MALNMKALMQNNKLTMQEKLMTFMMFSDPNTLTDNPNVETFKELGKQIKKLIDDSLITLHGFDENFNLKIEKDWKTI